MKCNRCQSPLEEADALSQGSQTLCEDCLMDSMSPSKACDPWAVKLAKGAVLEGGGEKDLQGLERALYALVTERGAVPREAIPALLGVPPRDVERAFSVLRHMELLRGERRDDGGANLVPFGSI